MIIILTVILLVLLVIILVKIDRKSSRKSTLRMNSVCGGCACGVSDVDQNSDNCKYAQLASQYSFDTNSGEAFMMASSSDPETLYANLKNNPDKLQFMYAGKNYTVNKGCNPNGQSIAACGDDLGNVMPYPTSGSCPSCPW